MNSDENIQQSSTSSSGSRLSKTQKHLLAGALARSTSAVLMYPVDVCKTRMQFQRKASPEIFNVVYKNSFQSIVHMIKHEGFGIYRGLSVRLLYVGPGAAITFVAYERFRESAKIAKEQNSSIFTSYAFFSSLAVGVIGRMLEIGIRTPFNVVKQQLQVEGQLVQKVNPGIVKSISHLVNTKGIRGLFIGYNITLLRDIPFSFIYFSMYEVINNKSTEYNIPVFKDTASVRGALAGCIASCATLPFDVIKTRIQTQEKIPPQFRTVQYNGYIDAVTKIFSKEGLAALLSMCMKN
ncbi:hypothetical protein ABK040_015584 [Willaertia magna]